MPSGPSAASGQAGAGLTTAASIDDIVNQKVAEGMKKILKKIVVLVEEQVRLQLHQLIQDTGGGFLQANMGPKSSVRELTMTT